MGGSSVDEERLTSSSLRTELCEQKKMLADASFPITESRTKRGFGERALDVIHGPCGMLGSVGPRGRALATATNRDSKEEVYDHIPVHFWREFTPATTHLSTGARM